MAKLTKNELARRTFTETLQYDLDGCKLDDLVAQYGPGCFIDVDHYYDDCTVTLQRTREETDEEYEARIETAKAREVAEAEQKRKQKAKQEAAERTTYERLKKKFG